MFFLLNCPTVPRFDCPPTTMPRWLATALTAAAGVAASASPPPELRAAPLADFLLDLPDALPAEFRFAEAAAETEAAVVAAAPTNQQAHVPYFLRSYNATGDVHTLATSDGNPGLPAWLAGLNHYRLLPGIFPKGMEFHFDGLATVMKFSIGADASQVHYFAKPYASKAATEYKKCIFFGTGTGPTLGTEICFTNPGVNLLPIGEQLWLTIDTSKWGRVDPGTLETVDATVNVSSFVLNAHPACDRATGECFVQHPCPKKSSPLSDQVCFSLLEPADGSASADMQTRLLSRATMPYRKIIQHSHSPCVTPHWVVSKLDAFSARNPLNKNGGLLKYLHQGEDSLWMVMNRTSKVSRILSSGDAKFVNNHFWNCFEDPADGAIVVEAVAATEDYLDNYFQRNLDSGADWSKLFHPSTRCRIPADESDLTVACGPLLRGADADLVFDYPTFNPLFKMRPDYRFFYGIAAADAGSSRWFDRAIKVDAKAGKVVQSWSSPGIYMTEFDFIPRTNGTAAADEDDGVLVSVLYNETSDVSLFGVFDARELTPLELFQMDAVIPFHAHGISCRNGEPCFTNP